MARPRKTVDPTKLRDLALIGCSIETMARNLNVSRDTLERRYRTVIEEGRGDGETRILAKIFQSALAGNVRCLEISALNRCNWSNKPELIVNVTQNAGPPPLNQSQMRERIVAAQEFTRKYLAEHNGEVS